MASPALDILLYHAILNDWMNHKIGRHQYLETPVSGSGVARAFPGGRLAHPEGQNEEENK